MRSERHVNWLLALLRVSSIRFAALYFPAFYIALLATGVGGWFWIVFGAFHSAAQSIGTELVNRLSDETEDRVNRPERTALCDVVGYARLRKITIGLWAIVALVDVCCLVLAQNPLLAGLVLLAAAIPINYSYGLRFKGNRYLVLVALTSPFWQPFLIGWAVHNPLLDWDRAATDLVRNIVPLFVVVSAFILSLAGIKDITDIAGDEKIGYRSLWVKLIQTNGHAVVLAVVSMPFLVLMAMVGANALPTRYLFLALFAPLSWLVATYSRAAATSRQQQGVRELFYNYWFAFSGAALFLYFPTATTLLVLAGSALFWVVATQYLHWSDGLRVLKHLPGFARQESQVGLVSAP